MADVKTLIKEARKLVDERNFKEAQECCKSILRIDKQNYLALVLLGKSLQESDQAPLAFQKAIKCKPDNPLAWFGLVNYYEKQNSSDFESKLTKTYEEILKLNLEPDKLTEIISKIVQVCIEKKDSECISIILKFINQSAEDCKGKNHAIQSLIKILNNNVKCKSNDIKSCLQILTQYYEQSSDASVENILAELTLQSNDFEVAVENTMKLVFFNTNTNVKKMLCEKIFNTYVESGTCSGVKLESIMQQAISGINISKQAKHLNSIVLFEMGQILDAYKNTVEIINFQQPTVNEAKFLLKCAESLENWDVTEKLALTFIDKLKDKEHLYFKKVLFLGFVRQLEWMKAFDAIKDVPVETLSIPEKAYLAECYIELKKDVSNLLDHLKETEYFVRLLCLQLIKQKRYHDVINTLENSNIEKDGHNLLYLGISYWEEKQFEKCIFNLLKAAKLDSNNAQVFLYLGHYYSGSANELQRARKCYEKANNLKPFDNEITKSLSEVYLKLEMAVKDFDLLQKYSVNRQSFELWLCFRLGLHYLNRREWENAISNFRMVIKQDRHNPTALECLADAYYGRGSHTSALRAYNLVISLDSQREYHCQMRIGFIYSLLTQYKEALIAFNRVLTIKPLSVLALKGISETYLRIAKKKSEAKLYGSSRDCAQEAIDHLSLALTEQKQYACLWKLLGDALIFITKLPNQYAFVHLKEDFNNSMDKITRNKIDIFPQAIACYSYVSKSKQEVASYDLAMSYYAYYRESQKSSHLHVSINLTTTCLKRNPDSWKNWTLLGKLLFNVKKYNLSQHCFIKALLTTKKWGVSKIWCNLGSLYVDLQLFKLANYCFWRGQSTMPSYPHSWIGQALIAEVIREEEAMDLFRHASRLGYHRESALGYADWVCRTLRNGRREDWSDFKYVIEGLHAVSYAIDLMEWFLCHEPDNACALTILGILQERHGLVSAALKSFKKAHNNAPQEKKNITMLNMARIQLRLGNHEEAITCFKSVTEASFDSACGLALALYRNGLYEDSYSAYDTALHWLSNEDDEKAELLVAMAGIVYKFKGADDAKTLLFHSIQVSQKKPTARSLFGICSLGLLQPDPSLSKLAISELRKYEKDQEFSFHITFLKSYILFCENSISESVKMLSEALHEYPQNSALWYLMSQYLIKKDERSGKRASICAQKALCSSNTRKQEWEPPKALATASISEYIAGDKKKAIKLATIGLHLYPENSDILAALIFTIVTNKSLANLKQFVAKLIKNIRGILRPTKPLVRWLNFLDKKINTK